jgi:peptide/nickel transport system substrate-binding protein
MTIFRLPETHLMQDRTPERGQALRCAPEPVPFDAAGPRSEQVLHRPWKWGLAPSVPTRCLSPFPGQDRTPERGQALRCAPEPVPFQASGPGQQHGLHRSWKRGLALSVLARCLSPFSREGRRFKWDRQPWVAPWLTLIVLLCSGQVSSAQTQTPAQAAGAKARASDLLKSPPFDRITLIDNAVFEVEPISPRPLPPLDPKKKKTLADLDDRPKRGDPMVKKDVDEVDQFVIIHMMDGEIRDFKVKRGSIKSVEYFEDMVLAEGDKLVREGDFIRAFERYLLVKGRDPDWKGLDERVNRLLFDEGSAALIDDSARGLRLLADLHARQPDYPGLADRLASSFGKRIEKAFDAGEYLVARRLLKELDQAAPNHAEGRVARGRLFGRAKSLIDQAVKANPSDRVDRLSEASRIWPESEGLESAYREAFRAEPTLTVAVDGLAEPVGPFPTTPASDRLARLIYLPLLASDDEVSTRGEVAGQLLAGLQTVELGRGVKITLKPGAVWSDGSRPVTAIDVARSMADRALAASPGYNARWADLLERVAAVDDTHLDIKLTRPSMKIESWLLGPVGPAHASSDGWVSSVGQGRKPVGDGLYRWESSTDASILLHSIESEATGGSPKIKRVRELRYSNPTAAIDALLRSEVALLEHVPPELLPELLKLSESIKVGKFTTPSVHRIALDGRNPMLRNRKLRRALSMAIDRKTLLEEVVLRRPPDDLNTVSDGPFVKGSFVDAPDVQPLEYNPILAKGLVAAAKKELGGNPIKLTLQFPPSAEARAACPKLAEAFALIGVEVQLIERPGSDLENDLHAGRKFDLAYRASRPTQPLHDAGLLLLPGYDAPPLADALASAASPRILQLLIQLDRAPETTSAKTLAQDIDRESRDELPVLPLWQLEDHYAWRTLLKGPLESIEHLYDGIAKWEIEPWFEKDPS